MEGERAGTVVQGERGRQGVWKLAGIKLLSHTMKLWEKVIDSKIRNDVTIAEQQFGFMPGRSTTEAIFCLRMLMEKRNEGQKAVHCVFIDLEKAYDKIP